MIRTTDRQMTGWAKSITLFQGFSVTWACQKKEEWLPGSKKALTNTHDDTLGYGKAEGKGLERSIRRTDSAVPVFKFFSSERKVPSRQCHLSPEPEGFSSGCFWSQRWELPQSHKGEGEGESLASASALFGGRADSPTLLSAA